MNAVLLAGFGWLIPGGTYLLLRRYFQFAGFAVLVWAAVAIGIALHGGYAWPQSAELQGVDGFTAFFFKAGALAKLLAGGPVLLARFSGGSNSFLDGRLHEYGTTLLVLAGIFNLMAVSDAIELRKANR
ncbi:MAG TPA: DUF6677 family protein [Bryobacteraceae bacterium]|jgi:hypothetical protein